MVKNDQKELPDSVSGLRKAVSLMEKSIKDEEQITAKIKQENNELINQNNELKNQRSSLESQNEILYEELRLLRLKLYARISERFDLDEKAVQRLLFPDLFKDDTESKPKDKDYDIIAEHKRKKPDRNKFPDNLPTIVITHDIPDNEKQCCGTEKNIIGYEESKKLRIKPAEFKVELHRRPKYGCGICEGLESDGPAISIAPMPPVMIPKSFSTPSLLAHTFVSKFCDALPFYRQEKQFKRYGVELNRSTMSTWAIKVGEKLKPLLELLRLYVLSGPLLNVDETTVQVLEEPGRKAKSKSYSWVIRGGLPQSPGFLFHYAPSRSAAVAKELLADYEGFVQTDGFASYNFLNKHPKITHFGCWAHVRRKFNEVLKVSGQRSKGLAAEAMTMIKALYSIEKEAKKEKLDEALIYKLRQVRSKPIIEKFETWLYDNVGNIPEQSLLGKAFKYTLGQWPLLIKYIENGIVRMDNNLAENAIRPFVIGRKNWLFSVTPEGAKATALFYSLIETAKANGLEPYKYLKYLFYQFPIVMEKYKNSTEITKKLFLLLPMNMTQVEVNQKLENIEF